MACNHPLRLGVVLQKLVPKGQRRLADAEEKMIALYARGSSTCDIQAQLYELYGVEISATLISQVTDSPVTVLIKKAATYLIAAQSTF